MHRRYIGIRELSKYLALPVGSLYVWVCHKKIPYLKVGRLLRFDLEEIDRWLKNKRVKTLD